MSKKRKLSLKKKFELIVSIFLIIVIGICLAISVMYGFSKDWIGFAICLSVAVALSVIEIPLWYHGATYECPKCGQKFNVNPYKVFLTNFFYFDFLNGAYSSNYKKLKCPHCNAKEWCKIDYK